MPPRKSAKKPTDKKSSAVRSSGQQTLAPCFVLAIVAFAFYSNIYGNAFLFDDEMDIVNNGLLRSWRTIGTLLFSSSTAGVGGSDLFYRPLREFLYLVVYSLFGLSTAAFHLLNVSLHAANAGLLYTLGRKLNFTRGAAFFAALIWALHPLQVEAVTYMSGTADPLYVLFCLLGLIVITPDFAPRKYLYVCPLYLLAMLSKESGIIFPFLAIATQYLKSEDRTDLKIYRRTWPLWITLAFYLLLRRLVIANDLAFYTMPNLYTEHLSVRLYTFLATLPAYAKLFVWPFDLHMDRVFPVYPDPFHIAVFLGFGMVAGSLGLIGAGHVRQRPTLSWGLLWFAVAYALNSGVLMPMNSIFLEHWMYLPTAGLCLAVGQALAVSIGVGKDSQRLNRITFVALVAVAILFGARTMDQNAVWHDPVTFYQHAILSGSRSARVHNNLGNAYADEGKLDAAIEQFRQAVEVSQDSYAQVRHNLALALLALPDRSDHLDEAIADLNRAIEIDPNFFQSYGMLANVYAYQGDKPKEILYRRKSEELRAKFNIPSDAYPQPKLTSGE